MRYWARPGCFSKLSDAFHTWNEWLWEACRISVGEANLAGWGRTHPWGPSFDTISRSTLSTFRPWPSAIPKDSPLLLPSPTHTVGPKGRNTHCSYRLCEKFSGLCENKDPEFLQGNGIVSETNKQTNLIWWLSMRKARGELFTVGSSSDFIHLEAKAGSRPWPCWGNNSGHSEPPQGLPVSSAQTAGEGVVCVDYLCSLSEKTQQKNKAPLLLAMLAAPPYSTAGFLLLRSGRPGCAKVLPAAISWVPARFTLSWMLTVKQGSRVGGGERLEEKMQFCDWGDMPIQIIIHVVQTHSLEEAWDPCVWGVGDGGRKVKDKGLKRRGGGSRAPGEPDSHLELFVDFWSQLLVHWCSPSGALLRSLSSGVCQCCSHTFGETHSLGRIMQIVECSLLHRWAQGRVSSQPRTPTSFCVYLIYPKCTCSNPPPQILWN